MSKDQPMHVLGQLQALQMDRLAQLARVACSLRTLCQMGHRDRALESCSGNEVRLHVFLQLIEQLEGSIKSGATLEQTLQQMLQEGWVSRLERFEEVE